MGRDCIKETLEGGKERKLESITFWETNTQGWVDHSLHVMPQSNTEGGWVLG